ncbi:hypothetical protein GCK32_020007 [Trichostrongylus colubriformis]|uniref:Uncharacterized protein n=1 Tax=Trichostrongylus colubriformis TaxID=6319 RepID=A0AAN8FF03_TRICO
MVQNFEDESTEVRTRTSEEFLASGLSGQIEKAIVAIRDIGPKIRADLEGARIAAKYRAIIEQAVRDIVAEIQELQDKQGKDRRNSFDELSDDPMEDDSTSSRAESGSNADWSTLRAALETAFGSLGHSRGAMRSRSELHGEFSKILASK